MKIQGKQVPLKLYREKRWDVRVSIGKHTIHLRIPTFLTPEQEEEHFARITKWLHEQFSNKEELRSRFFGKGYRNGDTLTVGKRTYTLHFNFSDKKSHSVNINNGNIYLHLSKNDTEAHLQKAIKHLLSRIVAHDFKPEIYRRVNELNNMYFRRPIKSLNFKLNQTNWGSCSSKGNLNLSTRLLFAPDDVIDYVIIHELAHLIELNHSPRFWKLVKNAMPDYQEKELWLKENGHLCNF